MSTETVSSESVSFETRRTVSETFEGFRVGLSVVYNKNDALNTLLKTPKEKEEECIEAGMKRVRALNRMDVYVERYVDPRFQVDLCTRTESTEFIPDYDPRPLQIDTTKKNRKRGGLFKFECLSPRVNV
jgi:hypothetical protein